MTLCFADGFRNVVRMTRAELLWEDLPAAAARAETEHAALYATPGKIREEDGHITADIPLWIEMRDPLTAGGAPSMRYFTFRDDWGELGAYTWNQLEHTYPESRYWEYFCPEDDEPLNG